MSTIKLFGGSYSTLDTLQGRLRSLIDRVPPEQRIIIALAGVPGSGKSTIAAGLLAKLRHDGIHDVVVAPMDGYHYTKATLSEFANSDEAFRRRGAPFTFDADSFLQAVQCLSLSPVSTQDDPAQDIWMPGFDHAIQDPVPLQIRIPATARVLIIEGNYVLLNQAPWDQIGRIATEKWFIDTCHDVAKQRIVKRHLAAGIEASLRAAEIRAEHNDMPNGDLIRENLVVPEVVIVNN